MTLRADPFVIARELSGNRPAGSQCDGPPKTKRHHYVFRVKSGGAEPIVAFACAHCEFGIDRARREVELTEAEVRRQEELSVAAHRSHCKSIRPEVRATGSSAKKLRRT